MAVIRNYKCKHCDKIYEEKVSIKDDVKTHCDVCGNKVKTIYNNHTKVMHFKSDFMGMAKEKTIHGYN